MADKSEALRGDGLLPSRAAGSLPDSYPEPRQLPTAGGARWVNEEDHQEECSLHNYRLSLGDALIIADKFTGWAKWEMAH